MLSTQIVLSTQRICAGNVGFASCCPDRSKDPHLSLSTVRLFFWWPDGRRARNRVDCGYPSTCCPCKSTLPCCHERSADHLQSPTLFFGRSLHGDDEFWTVHKWRHRFHSMTRLLRNRCTGFILWHASCVIDSFYDTPYSCVVASFYDTPSRWLSCAVRAVVWQNEQKKYIVCFQISIVRFQFSDFSFQISDFCLPESSNFSACLPVCRVCLA